MAWWVNVRALRAWLGLSVSEMAYFFQVSASTVYRWEASNCTPKPDALYRGLLTSAEDLRLRRRRKKRDEIVAALRGPRGGWRAALAVLLAE